MIQVKHVVADQEIGGSRVKNIEEKEKTAWNLNQTNECHEGFDAESPPENHRDARFQVQSLAEPLGRKAPLLKLRAHAKPGLIPNTTYAPLNPPKAVPRTPGAASPHTHPPKIIEKKSSTTQVLPLDNNTRTAFGGALWDEHRVAKERCALPTSLPFLRKWPPSLPAMCTLVLVGFVGGERGYAQRCEG